MNTVPEWVSDDIGGLDAEALKPFPNSRKSYAVGRAADIKVPMREVTQSPAVTLSGTEPNPSIFLYDTSGPYSDPSITIDIRRGLSALRREWIQARNDTEHCPNLPPPMAAASMRPTEVSRHVGCHDARNPAPPLLKCTTLNAGSLPRKWNSWPFAKAYVCERSGTRPRGRSIAGQGSARRSPRCSQRNSCAPKLLGAGDHSCQY